MLPYTMPPQEATDDDVDGILDFLKETIEEGKDPIEEIIREIEYLKLIELLRTHLKQRVVGLTRACENLGGMNG